jgi:hypothetical protein
VPTADASVYKIGAKSLKSITDAGEYVLATQTFPVKANQRALASWFMKSDFSGGTGLVSVRLNWLDEAGYMYTNSGYVAVTATQDWTATSTAALVPTGAKYAQISLFTQAVTGQVTSYFDDVVVNLA